MNDTPAATAQGGAVVADQPPAKAIDRTTRGSLWAIAAAVAFSSSTVVGKHLLDAYGVASLLWWRFSLAAVALWVLLAIRRRRGGPNPLNAPVAQLLGLGVAFATVVSAGFIGLQRLDASIYIVLVYVYPVLVVIGSCVGAMLGAVLMLGGRRLGYRIYAASNIVHLIATACVIGLWLLTVYLSFIAVLLVLYCSIPVGFLLYFRRNAVWLR